MMTGSYVIHFPLSSILNFLFIISSFQLSYCIENNTIFCPEIEKQSLLSFKQSLEDPKKLLSSWSAEVNCCKWKGVICNNLTGHVHQLHLRTSFPFFLFKGHVLTGKINPALLDLKYLRYLDLSGNALSGDTIPSFIGSFANLEYLNLSGTGFGGKVPHTIGNLSNLRTLDLGVFTYNQLSQLAVDSLEWLSWLSQLKYLNMDGVDLSKANNWAQVITSLPSLVELHFGYCSLDFMAPLDNLNTTTKLKHLYLSGNNISPITTPRWFFQLTNLLSLGLSGNAFTGPIPTTTNSTKLKNIYLSDNHFNSSIPEFLYLCKHLEHVDLSENLLIGTISNSIENLTSLNTLIVSHNQLSGKIPKEIANLCKIQRLDLSYNNFQGEIFGNMSECFLEALENLFLRNNKLCGHLTYQFGEFKSLQNLDLGNNSLSGVIPINIGKISSLEQLLLDSNKFTGTLPESLGQLFNLRVLSIDGNMLEGVVSETHFASLTKLETLSASRNQLTLKLAPNWIPPFQLTTLQLASWNLGLGSRILSWLEMQKNLRELDLSNTGTRGSLPRIADTMTRLDLSNNSFSGGVSHLLCDTTYETYRLESLQLGGNQLSGELSDCWMKWPSLIYLNLGSNNLSGSIPSSIGHLANLLSLNLHGNRLSGKIPFELHNCTLLVKMDIGDNDLDGGIPTWVGTGQFQLMFLILRSNKLSGEIPSEICQLTTLQILDLSGNKFTGVIPKCLYNFTAMATKRSLVYYIYYASFAMQGFADSASVVFKGSELQYESTLSLVTNINLSKNKLSGDIPEELTSLVELRSLNLSQNRLTGSIPEKIGDMKQLESLDFSMNSLSGQIPNSFKLLSFLGHLNLSHNKLTGRIPESTQLRGFDASAFSVNNLCDPPLTITCSGDDDDGRKEENEEEEEEGGDESKIKWLYVLVSLGYAVGLSTVCSALVLNKPWREAYFGLLERMWDELYVYVHITRNKLTKSQCSSVCFIVAFCVVLVC